MTQLPISLETERFELRWLNADELLELAFLGTVNGLANPCNLLTDKEESLAEFFAHRLLQNPIHETWTIRGIIDRGNNTLVGHTGFHLAPDSEGLVEVGYSIGEAFRRRGIAREAVAGLIAAARDSGAVRVVRGCTAPSNDLSKRVLTSLGFSFAGMLDDEEDGPEEAYLLWL